MEQVQMKYWWNMDIWKVSKFNFLNEEVEEFYKQVESKLG